MNKLRELASRVAKFPSTVLVEGETGVSKEIMANWIHFLIPPLRDRRENIEPLLNYFLNMCNAEFDMKKVFDKEVVDLLIGYDYYGNVREVRNIVENAYITSTTEVITVNDLLDYVYDHKKQSSSMTLSDIVDAAEKKAIETALKSESRIRKAAKLLEISNATLLRKMKKFGL